MVPAFMLSLLKRQTLLLPAHRFKDRYPGAWMIWEPGNWTAPPADQPDALETQLPNAPTPLTPRGDDALCFHLYIPGGVDRGQLMLGRGADNNLVVNDMTVSRAHLRLHFALGKWGVEALPSAATRLGPAVLVAGETQALESGNRLTVGGVTLSYYAPDGFILRLAKA